MRYKKATAELMWQFIEFILAAAGIFLLLILLYQIIGPSFNKDEETSKSYFDTLKKEIQKADSGGVGEFGIWGDNAKENDFPGIKHFLVYFGDGAVAKTRIGINGDNVLFKVSKTSKNQICMCFITSDGKAPNIGLGSPIAEYKTKCKYCFSLNNPTAFLSKPNDGSWVMDTRDGMHRINLDGGKYVFQRPLSAQQGSVRVNTCSGKDSQKWFFNPNGGITDINGRYLDVAGAKAEKKTQVILFPFKGNSNQKWKLSDNQIVSQISDKVNFCLDVPDYATAEGSKVIIWDCNGGKNQKWEYKDNQIINGFSGKCLDWDFPGRVERAVEVLGRKAKVVINDAGGGCNLYLADDATRAFSLRNGGLIEWASFLKEPLDIDYLASQEKSDILNGEIADHLSKLNGIIADYVLILKEPVIGILPDGSEFDIRYLDSYFPSLNDRKALGLIKDKELTGVPFHICVRVTEPKHSALDYGVLSLESGNYLMKYDSSAQKLVLLESKDGDNSEESLSPSQKVMKETLLGACSQELSLENDLILSDSQKSKLNDLKIRSFYYSMEGHFLVMGENSFGVPKGQYASSPSLSKKEGDTWIKSSGAYPLYGEIKKTLMQHCK